MYCILFHFHRFKIDILYYFVVLWEHNRTLTELADEVKWLFQIPE